MASTTRPWVSQISCPVRTSVATLANFMNTELSAFYFDIRKDSLYCDPRFETQSAWDDKTATYGNRRRAARTVMAAVLERLLTWLAPIMPFTMEGTPPISTTK